MRIPAYTDFRKRSIIIDPAEVLAVHVVSDGLTYPSCPSRTNTEVAVNDQLRFDEPTAIDGQSRAVIRLEDRRAATGLSIFYTMGGILVVVGIVLWILGAVGRPVGGRKVWF